MNVRLRRVVDVLCGLDGGPHAAVGAGDGLHPRTIASPAPPPRAGVNESLSSVLLLRVVGSKDE